MKPIQPNPYLDEPAPPTRQPRGNLLTVWLIFLGIANLLGLIRGLERASALNIAWAVFGLLCVAGIWGWFRVAYFALYLGFLFNMASSLDLFAGGRQSDAVILFLSSLTYAAVTFLLIHHRLNEFR
jgi:hypothetical protein